MADFTAKDVQRLRQATGAGMMDSKRALEETSGDFAAAVKWLRETGPGSADKVAAEREVFEAEARNSGKPEQALPKIVDGKLNGWYKERVLLEQGYAKDDKQSVKQVLGDAKIVRFAQVIVGA